MLAAVTLDAALALSGADASGAVQGSSPTPTVRTSLPTPDTVLRLASGPTLAIYRPPPESSDVVAVRLSVPLVEHPLERGAGTLLARLATMRMLDAVGTTGAEVSALRSPWSLSYAVEGAAADLDFLGSLLRIGVGPPSFAYSRFRELLAIYKDEASGAAEAPAEHVLALMLREIAPHRAVDGTGAEGPAPGMGYSLLRGFWARSHIPESMTVLIYSSAEPAVILAALGALGSPDPPPAGLEGAPAPPLPALLRPPVTKHWHGAAWSDDEPLDPRAPVLARLMFGQLSSGPSEIGISVSFVPLLDRSVLAVVGAAYPRRSNAVREQIRTLLGRVRDLLTESEVKKAARAVSLQRRKAASSPGALLSEIGEAYDATGDLTAAERRLKALDTLGIGRMLEYLDALDGPVTAQLPQ